MKEIKEIIGAMTSAEVRLLRQLYKVNGQGKGDKRLLLFEAAKANTDLTDQDIADQLYEGKKTSALSHLKNRLKNDLLDVMLIQNEGKGEAPFRQAEYECRKLLIKGDMLFKRGANDAALSVLNKGAVLVDKFELHGEGIMIHEMLRTHLGIRKGISVYESHTEKIQENLDKLRVILKGKEYLNKISLPNFFSKRPRSEFIDYTEEAFRVLGMVYYKKRSANVDYLANYIGLYYNEIREDYQGALHFAEHLSKLIQKNDPIYSPTRLAIAQLQISNQHLLLKNFKQAAISAEQSASNFKEGMLNQLIALELKFKALLYTNELKSAGETLELALKNKRTQKKTFLSGKWLMYRSAYDFARKNFSDALAILQMENQVLNDKSGWHIGHQLLETLCFIETNNPDRIDYRVEKIRKDLKKRSNDDLLRYQLIFQILKTFISCRYNFDETISKEINKLNMLDSKENNLKWDPSGFELIRFDHWFFGKSRKLKYKEKKLSKP